VNIPPKLLKYCIVYVPAHAFPLYHALHLVWGVREILRFLQKQALIWLSKCVIVRVPYTVIIIVSKSEFFMLTVLADFFQYLILCFTMTSFISSSTFVLVHWFFFLLVAELWPNIQFDYYSIYTRYISALLLSCLLMFIWYWYVGFTLSARYKFNFCSGVVFFCRKFALKYILIEGRKTLNVHWSFAIAMVHGHGKTSHV
jgi:hypothetical protein